MMQLQIKPNERVFPVTEGIDFLGYVIYPTYTRLRKRNKQNAARKLHKLKSKKRRHEIIASLYGQCKHADCRNLFYRLTGIKMNDFKSMGIKPKFDDGKKRFDGTVVSIRELVNLPIIVIDYEDGIRTNQGDGRCVVSVEVHGGLRKFFTNSAEMKSVLAQVRSWTMASLSLP